MTQPGAWIGLNNSNNVNGNWSWANGRSFIWNNWNWKQEPKPGLQCAVADFSLTDYQWKSENCVITNSYAVVCELRNSPPPTSKYPFSDKKFA